MSDRLTVAQRPTPGDMIELYQLDATVLGMPGIVYFCSSVNGAVPVLFAGNSYVPIPCESSGFEWSSSGTAPQPTIKIANGTSEFSSLAEEYGDLVGAKLTRIRTFRQFLDGGTDPDPEPVFPVDVYYIEQKPDQNCVYTEFKLSAVTDQEGIVLPYRTVIRDVCTALYRTYVGSAFDYSLSTCPYTGSGYFDSLGNVVTSPSADVCGKELSSCKLRFGSDSLPFWGFPGVGRTQTT